MDTLLKLKYEVEASDYLRGGEAASDLKKTLNHIGIPSRNIKRACVSCYEAEMNLVIHSYGGSITVEILEEKIVIEVLDMGPGIEDIEEAMREGFSTASRDARNMGFGAGMGLPNMRKNTDRFTIESKRGENTLIIMEIFLKGD